MPKIVISWTFPSFALSFEFLSLTLGITARNDFANVTIAPSCKLQIKAIQKKTIQRKTIQGKTIQRKTMSCLILDPRFLHQKLLKTSQKKRNPKIHFYVIATVFKQQSLKRKKRSRFSRVCPSFEVN